MTSLVTLVGAVIVAVLVLTALLKILKTTVTTALTIGAIVLILQLVFGIGPSQFLLQIPQTLWQLVTGGK
jgi:type IV secretory pathway TrbL component